MNIYEVQPIFSHPTHPFELTIDAPGSKSITNRALMLAAHACGVDSCWVHRAKEEFERPEGKAILERLGISGSYEGIGHCALGYAAAPLNPASPRKENYIYRIGPSKH